MDDNHRVPFCLSNSNRMSTLACICSTWRRKFCYPFHFSRRDASYCCTVLYCTVFGHAAVFAKTKMGAERLAKLMPLRRGNIHGYTRPLVCPRWHDMLWLTRHALFYCFCANTILLCAALVVLAGRWTRASSERELGRGRPRLPPRKTR